MRLLLDTHILLWAVAASRKLPTGARDLLIDPHNTILYSAASIWELAIKSGLGRKDFRVNVGQLLQAAAETGFTELPVTSTHAERVTTLPDLHRDPFDRLLIAQALTEPALLLTNDAQLGEYGQHVRVL